MNQKRKNLVADLAEQWSKGGLGIWRLRVYDGLSLIEECYAPINQLSEKAAKHFFRALVAKAHGWEAAEILQHFVNRRQGLVVRSDLLDAFKFCEPKRGIQGFWISDSHIHAVAELKMNEQQSKALQLNLDQQKS